MTIREALQQAARTIDVKDAELLLAHAIQRDKVWLKAHNSHDLASGDLHRFLELLERRIGHEPLQYILGTQEFFGFTFHVEPGVLIPRPETELLVEAVLTWAGSKVGDLQIIDVGTGSGAIALALASHLSHCEIIAVDSSPEALAIANRNARDLQLERVRFQLADLLQACEDNRFDIVVSNPPYIPSRDQSSMQLEVVAHEPHSALFAGEDGLDVYRRLVPQADAKLRNGGLLAMEFGYGQKPALTELLSCWSNVRFSDDYAGIPRIVLAEKHAS